jgi:hypothetical protein
LESIVSGYFFFVRRWRIARIAPRPPPIRRMVVGSGTGGVLANAGVEQQRKAIPAERKTAVEFFTLSALLFFPGTQMADHKEGANASAHQKDGGGFRNGRWGLAGKRR